MFIRTSPMMIFHKVLTTFTVIFFPYVYLSFPIKSNRIRYLTTEKELNQVFKSQFVNASGFIPHAVNKNCQFCWRLYDPKRIFQQKTLATTAHVVFERIWNSFIRFYPSDVLIIRPAGYTFRCEYVFYFSLFRINYWVHVPSPALPFRVQKRKVPLAF